MGRKKLIRSVTRDASKYDQKIRAPMLKDKKTNKTNRRNPSEKNNKVALMACPLKVMKSLKHSPIKRACFFFLMEIQWDFHTR